MDKKMSQKRKTGLSPGTLLAALMITATLLFPAPLTAATGYTANAAGPTLLPNAPTFALELTRGPYLTGMTANSVFINASTNETTGMDLQYADEDYFSTHGTYYDMGQTHSPATAFRFQLLRLEPDTVYHYRMKTGSLFTDDFQFRTFPAAGPFTFIVLSDTQDQLPQYSQYERYKLVADAAAAEPDIAFILHCGDLVNNGNNTTDWDRYFDVSRQLMAKTAVYACLGNHEKNSVNYYEAFGVTADYSFDCGDAHFTVLNSNDTTTAQRTWLDNDLDTGKPWKFTSFHHPMYSADPNHFGGWANLQEDWEGLFQEHGVSGVWNGHIHAYEHYLENGIHYTVIGAGGGPPGLLSPEKPEGYQNSLENCLAYAKVTVNSSSTATVQIVRVADISGGEVTTVYPPGTIYDTFTMTLPEPPQHEWDLNGDHTCNIGDVVVLGLVWDSTGDPGWIPEDMNNDGVINIGDVVVLGLHWGQVW